ncbi:MAG TPA: chorismate synthase [Magnetospirillaceae bacterium]|nr:chorismate synthase [Magnetospirillaceae bacterium]
MNTLGKIFRVSLFGESHGPAAGAVLDGIPPGLPLAEGDFEADLVRRRSGAAGTTDRKEPDLPELLSGLYGGRTTGTPVCIVFRNRDTRSEDYAPLASVPRPGHADFSGSVRYRGFQDPRGSGHFSGRITVGLVAAGVVAKKLIPGAIFTTRVLAAAGDPDVEAAALAASKAGDSAGALVEVRVSGIPAGLGEPFFDPVDGRIAAAVFAVPGVRGVEFGDGFAAARMRGSEHNDPILSRDGRTSRNGAGGVNGGITNGNEIVVHIAVKPASSIRVPQRTLDFDSGRITELSVPGRHDACIGLRAAVVLEAACAVCLADFALLARTYDAAAPGEQGYEEERHEAGTFEG